MRGLVISFLAPVRRKKHTFLYSIPRTLYTIIVVYVMLLIL
jgi:hypothetical protein